MSVARVRRLYVNRWARYAISIILLGLVLLKVQPGRLGVGLGSANGAYLGIALALTLPFLCLKVVRWHLLLRAARIEASFGEAAVSLVGGMGLALITPARLGELVRVAYLRDSQKWKAAGLVMIDKAFDVLVLAGLSIAGAWALLGAWAGLVLTAATVFGLIVVYRPALVLSALRRASPRLPMRPRLEATWSSLDSLSARSTSVFLALTAVAFLVVLLQFGVILLSWRSWSPDVVFLTFPLVILTNVLPLTIGGLGLREGAAALLLSRYGVPMADAALAAFLMFAINTALPGMVGAFLLPSASQAPPARTAQTLDQL